MTEVSSNENRLAGAAQLQSPVQALSQAGVQGNLQQAIGAMEAAVNPSAEVASPLGGGAFAATSSPSGVVSDVSGVSPEMAAEAVAQLPASVLGAGALSHLASKQGFKLGAVGVLVDYIDASELVDVPTVSYVPNTPNWFTGVTNLHGSVIPVVDLHSFLQLTEAELGDARHERQMMLVLGHGDDAVGVYVDGLPDRVSIAQNEDTIDVGLAPARLKSFAKSVYHLDGQMWCELDVKALLDNVEFSLQQ